MIYQNYSIGDELYHSGRLGQKWYKRNGPPYPLDRSALSASEKKAERRKSLFNKISERKRKKKQAETLAKAMATKAANAEKKRQAEAHEANKQKVLQSGSAEDVMKYKGELSNEELNRVLNRLRYEKELGDLSARDVKTTTDKIDSVINKIDKVRGWTEKGISAYNTAAKIINTLSDADLPVIKENSKSERINRDLDASIKQLQKENQRLKNEAESIRNEGERLKNEQTRMNQEKQLRKEKEIKKKERKEKTNKVLKRLGIKEV